MRLFAFIFVLVWAALAPSFLQGQTKASDGKYVLHTVTKGETVFNLCQKYKVQQSEIMRANPGLSAVLKAGTVVKVPVAQTTPAVPAQSVDKQVVEPKSQPVSNDFYYHKVAPKQTIFSIAKQYGITTDELVTNNPLVVNGLSVGQVLKIPGSHKAVEMSNVDKKAGTREFVEHQVVSGETLYNLGQRYGVSQSEIIENNPALHDGLKSGMKLKIPIVSDNQPVVDVAAPEVVHAYSKYQVEKGETLFSLASRFGVEVSDIKKANPDLFTRGLESGETILIPKQKSVPAEMPEISNVPESGAKKQRTACLPNVAARNQKYKAAFLLPFLLQGNDNPSPASINKAMLMSKVNVVKPVSSATDTTIALGTNIDQKIIGFLEFYEGALLAMDSLQRNGMNIELFVFDVSNQKMVNALLQMDEFLDMDLIVGPVYPELQASVAAFAAKNRIPMVSPLASTGNFEQNNPWYFKVNPTREYQVEQSAMYLATKMRDKNIVVLKAEGSTASAEAQMVRMSKEKLKTSSGKILYREHDLQQGANSSAQLLVDSGENVFVIPTDNEAQISVAVTNLTALAEHYDIVLFGTLILPKLKSIQTENYHRVRLRYLSPYFVDYSRPIVRRFVGHYREKFSAEPTPFSFQGFDVAYYFMSALHSFGKDFRECLPNYSMELTQMNFSFDRVSAMGGFENRSLFVTSYERNYDVLNLGAFGKESLGK